MTGAGDPELEALRAARARRPGCVVCAVGFAVFIALLIPLLLLEIDPLRAIFLAVTAALAAGQGVHWLLLRRRKAPAPPPAGAGS